MLHLILQELNRNKSLRQYSKWFDICLFSAFIQMFEGKKCSTSNNCTLKQVFKRFYIRLSPNDSFVENTRGIS